MTERFKIKKSSNRSFGLVFFFVFFAIALWPLTIEGQVRLWSIAISLVFLILGLINSKLLNPLNILWMKIGVLLGTVVSPIVMGIVFFLVVTPTGLIMRALGKDLLSKKFDGNRNSYWIKRDKTKSTMKQQF